MLTLGREIKLLSKVSAEIHNFLANARIEKGGVIFTDGSNTIVKFTPDLYADDSTVFSYTPNAKKLSEIINNTISSEGLYFAGFVHSHPNNSRLSDDDIAYIRKAITSTSYSSLICGVFDVSADVLEWYRISFNNVEKLMLQSLN